MESLVQWITEFMQGVPGEFVTFFISLLPILELRGGLVAAALLGVPYLTALWISVLGNMLPVPFVLWLITPIFNWLKKGPFKNLVEKIEKRSMGKSDKIQKYEFWGLVLFVGIPLPGTGAWTGTLIASMLGIKVKKAFPAIALGVCLAAAIMSFFTYGLPWIITTLF